MSEKEKWAIKVKAPGSAFWVIWTTHATLGEARTALENTQKGRWFAAQIVKLVQR